MKTLAALVLALVVAIVAIPHALGQRAPARPPGVAANSWVSINDNLGMVLESRVLPDTPVRANPQDLLLAPPLNGYFMVRNGDRWFRVIVAEPFRGPGDAG